MFIDWVSFNKSSKVVCVPIKAIVFIVFSLILQQLESNLIYPKVVGESIGLSALWVLFAVTLGGGLFGIVGMFIGVPTFAVIYIAVKEVVDERLKQNIEDIDISWVDELKLKEFEYRSTPNKKQIGLIAQDYLDKDYSKYFIEKIKIPNDKQEYYGISYGNITNALIRYCQDLKVRVDELEKRLNNE